MKKKLVLGLLVLLMVIPCFTETMRQVQNRANHFANEWNSLCDLQKSLDGESLINLKNYMMGFSEAATKIFDALYANYGSLGYADYIDQSEFYFTQYQLLLKYYGVKTANFRTDYYTAGFSRVYYGSARLGINDF